MEAEKKAAQQTDPEGINAFLNAEEMHKLGRISLMSRYVVEGNLAGAHRSPMKGSSSEFADHKNYTPGDDPKHIDWKVLGRTDRYYIKRYEDETNLRVYFAIDQSNSMGYGSTENMTKFKFACHLLAALGYVVVKARDSVGLFLFTERVNFEMGARNSFNHLNNMLKNLQKEKPGGTASIAESLNQIAEKIHKRALVVIISDLYGDEKAINLALAHFRKNLHDVIVFHVMDPMEIDLSMKNGFEFEDMETDEKLTVDPRAIAKDYQAMMAAFIEQYRVTCEGMKVDYRLVRTDLGIETYVRAYLEERRRFSK